MVLCISSDVDGKYFEVTTKNKKFLKYPGAFPGRFGTPCAVLNAKTWFNDLNAIASWVNNDLNEECLFEVF